MTPNEFKKLHPEFAHLEGDALWNKMEETMLSSGNTWTADYSEGKVEIYRHTFEDGREIIVFDSKYWINDKTGERLTSEEYNQKIKKLSPSPESNKALESYSFGFLDLKLEK